MKQLPDYIYILSLLWIPCAKDISYDIHVCHLYQFSMKLFLRPVNFIGVDVTILSSIKLQSWLSSMQLQSWLSTENIYYPILFEMVIFIHCSSGICHKFCQLYITSLDVTIVTNIHVDTSITYIGNTILSNICDK